MNIRFVIFVALRYFHSRRKSRGAATTILSVSGVAVGVMTLTAVLAVMNGFQLGFIESILEISSYHIQIEVKDKRPLDSETLNSLADLSAVRSIVPFAEYQAIAEGAFSGQRGCLIRALPPEVAQMDPSFMSHLKITAGAFNLDDPGSIVLGVELARHLGLGVGDTVALSTLAGASLSASQPGRLVFHIAGLFKSGYYEFDLGLGFISLASAQAYFERESIGELRYGIKIRDRFKDRKVVRLLSSKLGESDYRITSWREFNRAFFDALSMEKTMMMLLIGLIFIVVAFNIYHTLKRTVRERYEEIGVLKALGASNGLIQNIFILDGLLIGLSGGLLGMLLGLAISVNINQVFGAAEFITNLLLLLIGRLIYPLLGSGVERFSLFSSAYFYISEVPSRVLLHEAVLINIFALFSSVSAAFIASLKVADVRPVEVLRYE